MNGLRQSPNGFQTGKGNAYETKLRDKRFGRVYRVVYDGEKGLSAQELAASDALVKGGLNASDEKKLVAALQHTNMFWRKAAQRLLIEKATLSDETIKALAALTLAYKVDAIGNDPAAIHAIWVLSAHGKCAMRSSPQNPTALPCKRF